jgi:hypothetical protein
MISHLINQCVTAGLAVPSDLSGSFFRLSLRYKYYQNYCNAIQNRCGHRRPGLIKDRFLPAPYVISGISLVQNPPEYRLISNITSLGSYQFHISISFCTFAIKH